MSSLFINRDSNIMMLEVAVEKMYVPCTSPFDGVITSKFIVSFRFLDDEWIDIVPKRRDYKDYIGDVGEEQYFNGGKSVVFSLDQSDLAENASGLVLDIRARREISRYFENTNGNVTNLGCIPVVVDRLYNSIVEELRIREELKDYLHVIHKPDPISMSMKGTYNMDVIRGSYVELYVRLSHLGDCVLAEIDKPYYGPINYFLAQEQHNKSMAYECWELDPTKAKPHGPLPYPKPLLPCEVACCCTDDQRNRLFAKDDDDEGDTQEGKRTKTKRKKRKKDDSGCGKPKPEGNVTVGITDKDKPCEQICIPYCPEEVCCVESPCLTEVACVEPVYCIY